MSDDPQETIDRLHQLLKSMEENSVFINSPDDRRLIRLLIKLARSVEMTAWLGGMCIKLAPVIAAVWWFGDEGLKWLGSLLWPGK